MKVKLKDLRANPFRDFSINPIDEEKVEELVDNISSSGFWKGSTGQVRLVDGVPEIVFGHKRFEALKRVYGEDLEIEIDVDNGHPIIKVPSEELDDELMLKRMSRENRNQGTETTEIDEAVQGVYTLFNNDHNKWEKYWALCGEPVSNGKNNAYEKDGSLHVNFHVDTAGISDEMICSVTGHPINTVKQSRSRINIKKDPDINEDAINSIKSGRSSYAVASALKDLKKKGTTLSDDSQQELADRVNSGAYAKVGLKKKIIKEVNKQVDEPKAKKPSKAKKSMSKKKTEEVITSIEQYVTQAAILSEEFMEFTSGFISLQKQLGEYEITDKKALDKFAELKLILRAVYENTGEILDSLNVKK